MDSIRKVHSEVCVFDVEFVPDVELGRRLLKDMTKEVPYKDYWTDQRVCEAMQSEFGDDRGIMKSIMYRVVSISAVIKRAGQPPRLFTLPDDGDFDEAKMLKRFLTYLGDKRPQVVGYASHTFDIPTLFQRAIAKGVQVTSFCQRPAKPWDDYADYFSGGNDYNVDLLKVLGHYGNTVPKLEQLALACDIPAKLHGMDGSKVAPLWYDNRRDEIVMYNETDSLTTYLLWIRALMVHGLWTVAQYNEELSAVETLLNEQSETRPHLKDYFDEWLSLRGTVFEPMQVAESSTTAEKVETVEQTNDASTTEQTPPASPEPSEQPAEAPAVEQKSDKIPLDPDADTFCKKCMVAPATNKKDGLCDGCAVGTAVTSTAEKIKKATSKAKKTTLVDDEIDF